MNKRNPCTYFGDRYLYESLLICIVHDPEDNNIEFVFDEADWILSDKRSPEDKTRRFVRLVFEKVTGLVRNNVTLKMVDGKNLNYHAKGGPSVVVQSLMLKNYLQEYSITIGFGTFGNYHFNFVDLYENERFGLATEVKPCDWQYKDAQTGMPFDFWDPFESLR